MKARSGSRHRLSTRLVGGRAWFGFEGAGESKMVKKREIKEEQRLEEREETEEEVKYEDGTRGRNPRSIMY